MKVISFITRTNACYKSYTLRETLESVQKSNVSDNQTIQCGDEIEKMLSHVVRDWGAFIIKILIFFIRKEKEHPGRINMLKQWVS